MSKETLQVGDWVQIHTEGLRDVDTKEELSGRLTKIISTSPEGYWDGTHGCRIYVETTIPNWMPTGYPLGSEDVDYIAYQGSRLPKAGDKVKSQGGTYPVKELCMGCDRRSTEIPHVEYADRDSFDSLSSLTLIEEKEEPKEYVFKVSDRVKFTTKCASNIGEIFTIRTKEDNGSYTQYWFEGISGGCNVQSHFVLAESEQKTKITYIGESGHEYVVPVSDVKIGIDLGAEDKASTQIWTAIADDYSALGRTTYPVMSGSDEWGGRLNKIVNKESKMGTSNLQLSKLSADERYLRANGYKNQYGEVTSTGNSAMQEFLFSKNEAEFVKASKAADKAVRSAQKADAEELKTEAE